MCITTLGKVVGTDGKKALVEINGNISEVRTLVDVSEGDHVYCASGMAVEKVPGIEIEEGSRNLFMRYALPCAGTLVKRGTIKQEHVDILIDIVKNNRYIPDGSEKIFKVAFSACSLIAMKNGSESIDRNAIREYFLLGHDDAIEKRYGEMKDFDPQACRIKIGHVGLAENGSATVGCCGTKKYRTDFVPDAKENDIVITHWDFVVERINKAAAEKIKNTLGSYDSD